MIVPGSPNALLLAGFSDPLDDLGRVERSVRLRSSASSNLSRAVAAGNRKTWTFSAWVKRGGLSSGMFLLSAGPNTDAYFQYIILTADNKLLWFDRLSGGVNYRFQFTTELQLRDPSAHFHLLVVFDTTNATASERGRLYINGQRVAGTWTGGTYPALNTDYWMNHSLTHWIGQYQNGQYFDGYLSNIAFVDGHALEPTSFGKFHPRTGQWRPKSKGAIRAAVAAVSGDRNGWGTNGFFLPFDDPTSTTTLGYDRSQSDTDTTGNNWTLTNISLTAGATYDSMLDTPTCNFCTLNPLNNASSSMVDGNLKNSLNSGMCDSTHAIPSGKWYWEITVVTAGNQVLTGITPAGNRTLASGSLGYGGSDGKSYNSGVSTGYGETYTAGGVVGVAFDSQNGSLTFYKNGISQGVAFTGITGAYSPFLYGGSTTSSYTANFGQQPFAYSPPAGFKALCTKNFPINYPVMKSENAFVARTDSGANIVSTLSAAAPWTDWIRIYKRRDSAEGWRWQFSDDAANYLDSSSTAAKAAFPALAGSSYVGYALKVSAQNGVATGRLVHTNGVASVVIDGLANSRKVVILKNEATGNWHIYHPGLTAGKLLYLNSTALETADASISAVTSSGFTVAAALASGNYRWMSLAETDGFLKLGKYTGNGSTDGTFVYSGGTPLLTMTKCMDAAGTDFVDLDSVRDLGNLTDQYLAFNLPAAETTSSVSVADLISNGHKARGSGQNFNANSQSYVFIAIAAFPFRYANAR